MDMHGFCVFKNRIMIATFVEFQITVDDHNFVEYK